MNIHIKKGIQIPAFDVEMLSQGKLIVVPFIKTLRQGEIFWLYPSQKLPHDLSLEQYYQPQFLTSAKSAFDRYTKFPLNLTTWARCENYWRINPSQKYLLPKIAQSSIWNLSALEYFFCKSKNHVLKLYILRVHCLSLPHVVNVATPPGFFYGSKTSLNTTSDTDIPVINEPCFHERRKLFLAGKVYPHRDLEALQLQMQLTAQNNLNIEQLNYNIQQFLGCYCDTPTPQKSSELTWINDIASLGNRSKEQDKGKSNYQAGTDFENIVRQSLEFLGFTVDYFHKGGSGGVDIFCSGPFPLLGECKSGKKIPNNTAVQLLNLGTLRLKSQELLKQVTKLIIGPGKPTKQLEEAAKVHSMAIINPETLQKLAELKAQYPGSINLIELKSYLQPGISDNQIQRYINKVNKDIEIRSHIVQAVKELGVPGSKHESDAIAAVYNCNCRLATKEDLKLDISRVHEILIELSSPLTGYLGRIKGTDWETDKFYFLRDL